MVEEEGRFPDCATNKTLSLPIDLFSTQNPGEREGKERKGEEMEGKKEVRIKPA